MGILLNRRRLMVPQSGGGPTIYEWKPSDGTFDNAGFTTQQGSGSITYDDDGATVTGHRTNPPRIFLPVTKETPALCVEYTAEFVTFSTSADSGLATLLTYNGTKYTNFRAGTAYQTGQTDYGIYRYTNGSYKNLSTPQIAKSTDYHFKITYDIYSGFTVERDGVIILQTTVGTGTNSEANQVYGLLGTYIIKLLKVYAL